MATKAEPHMTLLLLFTCSVLSDSLWSHGLQHAIIPCHSPSPGACSNSCPLSQWCHPTISSSVPFPSWLQSFPPSGSFLMSPLFTSVSQFSHSVVSNSLRPHGLQHTRPPCPSPTPWGLLKLMFTELVMPSNYLIHCCPLLLLPSISPSIRVFSNESVLRIRWPK